jgi:Phage integrase, N-terminal SAM-like domain
LFARHFRQSPEALGPEDIRAYQLYLTNERQLAPSSILQAVGALGFLYKVTLPKPWTLQDVIPAPKKPQTLPVVLSPEEVLQFLSLRAGPQAPHPADDLLCGGLAHLGGHSAQSHRHRQPTHGHPDPTWEGAKRSLRDALAQAVGALARLVASGPAQGLALSGSSARWLAHQ